MHIIDFVDLVMINTCDIHDYKYVIITPNDIVIPPITENDIV